ncbi:MAG: ATP-binding protein [Nitrospirae bacterium]|nr:ATP-binding protein [Nitrospirota bacterium]
MGHGMESNDRIDFFIGSELRLEAILSAPDTAPLLKAVVKAGAEFASVADEKGRFLWTEGVVHNPEELQSHTVKRLEKGILKKPEPLKNSCCDKATCLLAPLLHEGEPIGFLLVYILDMPHESFLSGLVEIALMSLNITIKNNVKRILTTELHTTVVNRSYEELLGINKQLSASERKYKELAETLEKKVEERTAELKIAHTRLLQQEKMASIGQLAAGIAHEINNPIGFIYSNLNTFRRYAGNLGKMLEFYRSCVRGLPGGEPLLKQSEALYRSLKIDFIMSDINDLVQQSMDGSERIRNIVADLKGFSHIDETAGGEIDINAELDKTISVLAHEVTNKAANIIKDYGRLPAFYGNPDLICQVFLNIILNALQSKDDNPTINIKTMRSGNAITISVADNGRGIPDDVQGRIFEPFFTTKDVGKGMGMGLPVSYDIITAHGGSIEVQSQVGKGSIFIITLPLGNSGQLRC